MANTASNSNPRKINHISLKPNQMSSKRATIDSNHINFPTMDDRCAATDLHTPHTHPKYSATSSEDECESLSFITNHMFCGLDKAILKYFNFFAVPGVNIKEEEISEFEIMPSKSEEEVRVLISTNFHLCVI